MYSLFPSHSFWDVGGLDAKQLVQSAPSSVNSFVSVHSFLCVSWHHFSHWASLKTQSDCPYILLLKVRLAMDTAFSYFSLTLILYVAPCLQFRRHNSINVAKACISKPCLFVWEICIIKLCHTAEGPLTFCAFKTLRWQNKIYVDFQTRPLPRQQDVLIVFSWKCFINAQCQFFTKYKDRACWDFLDECMRYL